MKANCKLSLTTFASKKANPAPNGTRQGLDDTAESLTAKNEKERENSMKGKRRKNCSASHFDFDSTLTFYPSHAVCVIRLLLLSNPTFIQLSKLF